MRSWREKVLCALYNVRYVYPQYKIRFKNYSRVWLIVDETEEKIVNVIYKDCVASLGNNYITFKIKNIYLISFVIVGKHALALLIWVHRSNYSPTDEHAIG